MRPLEQETTQTEAAQREERRRFLARLQERDPEAMSQLFDLYFERVYAYVQHAVRDPHLSEDLTQDVFFNVYRRLETYDPEREILPWIFTIATNKVRDHWRSRRHSDSRHESSMDREEVAGTYSAGEERPHTPLEKAELAKSVHVAVERLPKGMRDTVRLRLFEGLPFRAIGEILGKNEAAVRKRYSRAIGTLRAGLAGVCALHLRTASLQGE